MLLIMTVAAFGTVFVAHGLPCVADRALELHTRRINSSEQAHHHTNIHAHESTSSGASILYIVQLSICALTIVDAAMLVWQIACSAHRCTHHATIGCVSTPTHAMHAPLIPSCACVCLTVDCVVVCCVCATVGECGRGVRQQARRFLSQPQFRKQQHAKAHHYMDKRLLYVDYNGAV